MQFIEQNEIFPSRFQNIAITQAHPPQIKNNLLSLNVPCLGGDGAAVAGVNLLVGEPLRQLNLT